MQTEEAYIVDWFAADTSAAATSGMEIPKQSARGNNQPRRGMGNVAASPRLEHDGGDRIVGDITSRAASRCYPKLVYNVIAKFDQQKKEIVRSIGFGGLLFLPLLSRLNIKLAAWLLGRVDVTSRAIVIDDQRVYRFHETDVHRVFGIPASGRDVRDKKLDGDEVIAKIGKRIGVSSKDGRSLKAAQAVLEKEHSEAMTAEEMRAFKTAFVMFVMAHLFAPTTKHDYCSLDYWPALQDPDTLASFNWGKYVIEELCDAAAKLKSDVRRKNRVSNITGCPLFLQVFYLDNIDVGVLNMRHDAFPRISVFTADRVRGMILADTVRIGPNRVETGFGLSMPQKTHECAYYKDDMLIVDHSEEELLWQTVCSLCATLNLPSTARSELFSAIKEHDLITLTKIRVIVNSSTLEFCQRLVSIATKFRTDAGPPILSDNSHPDRGANVTTDYSELQPNTDYDVSTNAQYSGTSSLPQGPCSSDRSPIPDMNTTPFFQKQRVQQLEDETQAVSMLIRLHAAGRTWW